MNVILRKSDAAEPYTFAFVAGDGKNLLRSENYKASRSSTSNPVTAKSSPPAPCSTPPMPATPPSPN